MAFTDFYRQARWAQIESGQLAAFKQKQELSVWHEAWLDAQQTGSAPAPLDWVK